MQTMLNLIHHFQSLSRKKISFFLMTALSGFNFLFALGLFIRLGLIFVLYPQSILEWFGPFMTYTASHFAWDPWGQHLQSGGSILAFPYGYVMWLTFLPLTFIGKLTNMSPKFSYYFTLLLVDVFLLGLLRNLFCIKNKSLLINYWLSPIVIFPTYILGLNDLIPVTLLCLALQAARDLNYSRSGFFCALAVSAKLSMSLSIPFFIIYLYHNKPFRMFLFPYFKIFFITLFCLNFPLIFSAASVKMIFFNPEISKIYDLSIQIGDRIRVYLLPMAYILMVCFTWWIKRFDFKILNVLLGISFLLVVLLTPASPGWFIWTIPIITLYQSSCNAKKRILVHIFTFLYLFSNFLNMPQPLIWGTEVAKEFGQIIEHQLTPKGIDILHTLMMTFGIVLIIRIFREGIFANDYFRLSRKPLVIGIAGDSGSGKDSLSQALLSLFGEHSVIQLSGDNYHLWDRQKPVWQVMTHLNPSANDLERFAKDLNALVDGKRILSRHYDHSTGKISPPKKVDSNDFIIVSGLHALHLPSLRNHYDLSIYLKIDETLRRYFKLRRDCHERGKNIEEIIRSIRKRFKDSEKFVKPQLQHADLIFCLEPIHPHLIEKSLEENNFSSEIRFKLSIHSKDEWPIENLVRALIGICGLYIEIDDENLPETLIIEGESSKEDIALAAKKLFPKMKAFLDIYPFWQDGVIGIMQLITLSHINLKLHGRLT